MYKTINIFLACRRCGPTKLSEEERLSIDRFARDWLAKALQEGSKNVISMLQAFQVTDPLFKYKFVHYDEMRLTGFYFYVR